MWPYFFAQCKAPVKFNKKHVIFVICCAQLQQYCKTVVKHRIEYKENFLISEIIFINNYKLYKRINVYVYQYCFLLQ